MIQGMYVWIRKKPIFLWRWKCTVMMTYSPGNDTRVRLSVSDKSAAHRFTGTTQSLCYYCGSISNRCGRRLGFCLRAVRFWSSPSKFLLNVCPRQQNEAPTARIPCSEASKEKVKAGMKEKKNGDLRASVNLVGYTTVWEKWGPSKNWNPGQVHFCYGLMCQNVQNMPFILEHDRIF